MILGLVWDRPGQVSIGGMATKLAAARIAQGAGCATLITLGKRPAFRSRSVSHEQNA